VADGGRRVLGATVMCETCQAEPGPDELWFRLVSVPRPPEAPQNGPEFCGWDCLDVYVAREATRRRPDPNPVTA
jgi:hypothetical protein